LGKKAEQVLPGRDGGKRKGTGRRNGLNNVCTYEYMNKEKKNSRQAVLMFFVIYLKGSREEKIIN
jgi:hypothetical protein